MKAEAPCAVANLAVAAAPGEEGEEITPQSALVSHSSSIPRSCRKPCTELSPQQEWFISKREFISLSLCFSPGKAPFQQLLHVQASRACWRLSPQRLLLLPINNISDAQATQSHCRKGQQESSSPREITLHNCPMAQAAWTAANALDIIRAGSRWECSDETFYWKMLIHRHQNVSWKCSIFF